MRTLLLTVAGAMALSAGGPVGPASQSSPAMPDVRLMTLDPGHFHAALVQKEMYPGVASKVDVYAPLGPDLLEHLGRISAYNHRAEAPTDWQLDVHTGPDFLARMLHDRPGNVVVLSGRNRGKIERIAQSVDAGLNVLADKPWILKPDDLPVLERTLRSAGEKKVVAYDIMTERFEITTILQRALVNDPAVFGTIERGSGADPGVYMESVHFLMKTVSGAPNIRPAWFFDTAEQGEGVNDIGTHLVDLVQWTIFPEQAIDYRSDIEVVAAQRWPTVIPEAEFARVTGLKTFPDSLEPALANGSLEYYCNTLVSYTLRGVHTTLNVIWDWEPGPGGGDTHFAFYRGTRARIEVRQAKEASHQPELYVIPTSGTDRTALLDAVRARLSALQEQYPGLTAEARGDEIHVVVPAAFRVGHEAHFAQVTANFLHYLRTPGSMPAWERPNMLAKYFVTTTGAELSRSGPPRPSTRIAR